MRYTRSERNATTTADANIAGATVTVAVVLEVREKEKVIEREKKREEKIREENDEILLR